jgi:hypothetical protein
MVPKTKSISDMVLSSLALVESGKMHENQEALLASTVKPTIIRRVILLLYSFDLADLAAGSFLAISRKSFRRILPLAVFGIASNHTTPPLSCLYCAALLFT